jgi:hypothetical protein
MDDEKELEPAPGDEDGDGEDQDAQYDVEEADTFEPVEPVEVNVKAAKVVHCTAASAFNFN